MPDKKLTDEEIIKAYEFCLNNKNCIGCIADKNSKSGEFDCKLKPQDIIDVFNRLQAENEKQTAKFPFYNELFKAYECPSCHKRIIYNKSGYCGLCGQKIDWRVEYQEENWTDIDVKIAKAEAYKEFADMLKKHSYFEHKQVVAVELIDNLLKELVGDSQ